MATGYAGPRRAIADHAQAVQRLALELAAAFLAHAEQGTDLLVRVLAVAQEAVPHPFTPARRP
jgi:hypothetical protein